MTTLPEPYYQDASCTIYNADCKIILPLLEPVDLVLTDPPYGIGADVTMNKQGGQKYGKAAASKRHYEASGWDNKPIDEQVISAAIKAGKSAIVFGGNYYSMPASSCWLVWDKVNGSNNFADCELAWTNLNKAVRKYSYLWNGMLQQDMKNKEHRHHPTQKPLPLMKWCIGQVPTAKTILDPFMGSGTTLVAAKALGLHAIGIEREEKYCQIAVERLRQESLFSVMGGA